VYLINIISSYAAVLTRAAAFFISLRLAAEGRSQLQAAGVLALIVVGIAVVMGFMIIQENRRQREAFLKRLKKSWGKKPERKVSAEEFASIGALARDDRGQDAERFAVDDITWHDLGMDDIFRLMDAAVSSPGDEVLYDWLRHPLFDPKEIGERDALITFFETHEAERIRVQTALGAVGRMRRFSFYEYMTRLREAKEVGLAPFAAAGLLSLASLVTLFIWPVAGILLLMAALGINVSLYLKARDGIYMYLSGFKCVLRLLAGAEAVVKLGIPELADLTGRLEEENRKLASMRRGAFLVTTAGQVGGMGEAVLEYLKMFFHPDIFKFNQMLGTFRGQEDACISILRTLGTLDAACAAASFRAFLPWWCRAEFSEEEGAAGVDAEGMIHPLLANPVDNDFSFRGGVLITGSNASGKSTFLKNTAICQLLAQSAATVPAKKWRSGLLRVLTSMALTDDLAGGDSYFVVEIKSLKRILDAATDGRGPILGVVDEVLRGTNTIERVAASARILESLGQTGSFILAATHDIELSYMLEGIFANCHFAEEIKGQDVAFNYKLTEGRSMTRNAIRLLGIAGYPEEIVAGARENAEHFERTGEWRKADGAGL